MTRIYQPVSLVVNTMLSLDEKASHHLSRVLRANVNDKIILFNGAGGEYDAVITNITKKSVEVTIQSFNPREVESPIEIYLAQGIARGEKMDFIVQKAVELGVTKIIPLVTERCNVRLDKEREEKRLQHWRSVAISACEQSGRNCVPEVLAPMDLVDWLPEANAELCFILSPHVETKLEVVEKPRSVALLIGPEGGLSEREVELAVKHRFVPLNLGPRVLRTETAPIAAVAVLQMRFGDFR